MRIIKSFLAAFAIILSLSVITTIYAQIDDNEEIFHSAERFFQLKEYEKAKKDYERVLENDPSFAEAYWGIGKIFHRTGEFAEALKQYEKALSIEPDNLLIQSDMGNVLVRMYQLDRGEKILSEVHIRNSTHFDAINGLAEIYSMKGNFEKELEFRHKVLSIDPDNVEAIIGIANSLHGMRNFDEAISYYDFALGKEPSNVNAMNGKANSYFGLRQYEEAKKIYQETLRIDPQNVNAMNGLGNIQNALTGEIYENANYLTESTVKKSDYENGLFSEIVVLISITGIGVGVILFVFFLKKRKSKIN